MSEQSVTLLPGRVSTVSTGLPAGTTVYNGDPTSAVWISANPMPGPGNGMRIGPKGSLAWTTDGAAVYGAPDTGVTSAVTLTLSSNVGSLVNPVDVGAAVATQLLNQGVPSVLLGKTVYNGVVPLSVTPSSHYFQLPTNVGQYASIILLLTSSVNQAVLVFWRDSASGQTVSSRWYMMAAAPVDSNTLQLEVPIKADQLWFMFTDSTPGAVTLNAYASNRSLVEKVSGTPPVYQSTIPSTAYAAYQYATFPNAFYSPGGMHTIHLTPNGSNATGYFGLYGTDQNGAATTVSLLDTSVAKAGAGTEPEINATLIFPAGYYRLWWQNGGAAQTYQTTINIALPA